MSRVHREVQQQRMIEAATLIARRDGVRAVTPAGIAAHTGLARTTIYDYFKSSADLVADVVVDELISMNMRIENEMTTQESPRAVILTWMHIMLDYIQSGEHKIIRESISLDLPPTRRAQIGEQHQQMMRPLAIALESVGMTDSARVGMHIQSIVDVCARRIEAGCDAAAEIAAAENFVLKALDL